MSNAHSKTSPWARSTRVANVSDSLVAASFALPLIAYGYLGSYSRYMADDYSASRMVRTHGFLGAQIARYERWTGRFAFTFVDTLLALIGPATPRFVSALLLALWFSAAVWATYRLQVLCGSVSWARIALFAGFIIFLTLETAPNVSQSLYWQTGALTYVAPFIPLSLYVGVVCRSVSDKQSRFSYVFNLACAGMLPFIAGGFSDAYVVMQTCGLLISLLAVETFATSKLKSRIRPFLVIGLVASLSALIVVALAPGNSIRQAYFPKQFSDWDIFAATFRYSVGFIVKLVITNPIVFITSLLLPFLIVLRDLSRSDNPAWDRPVCIRLLVFIPAAVFALIMCGTATSIYTLSVMLPERARILLSLIFVCGVVLWSHTAGEYVAGKLRTRDSKVRQNMSVLATVALMLLISCPLISFVSTLARLGDARSFAVDWDKQDAELKSAKQRGVTDVTVPQIGDFQSRTGKGLSDLHLSADPAFWINRETATYYGLNSVRASDDRTIPRSPG